MDKPAQIRRGKTRSLEVLVTTLCRLHRRVQERQFSLSEMKKRRYLRDAVRRLAMRIDGEYYDLKWMIRDGEADAVRVRAALKALEIMIREGVGLLKHQRTYLLAALKRSSEGKSLDRAFGVESGKRGRPPVPRQRQVDIATGVLRLMLKGRNLDAAALQVGNEEGVGDSQVRRYWAENKLSALVNLRSERPLSRYPWKKDEAKQLERLFGKDSRRVAKLLKEESDAVIKSRG